ncbi:hypothetical protein M0R45_034014 [Rubus argutus]|uniref:Uncharacterized protein n=1 Tax=Rubus argutus TaxID=59490 RepID=A0AAW1VP77_RUBAR
MSIGDVTVPQQFAHTGIWDWMNLNGTFFSESGKANTALPLFWANTTQKWLQGIKLVQCVNSSLCLPQKPKLVVGLSGSTANTLVDNAAYWNFLFQTFRISYVDMESSAVVMTS